MRLGPVIHGALLVVALIAAYGTLKHTKAPELNAGKIIVWNKPASSVTTVTYDSHNKTVRIERRKDGNQSYLWGTETHTRPAPKTPKTAKAKPPASATASASTSKKGAKAADTSKAPGKKAVAKASTSTKTANASSSSASSSSASNSSASSSSTSSSSTAPPAPSQIISQFQFPVGQGGQDVLKAVAKLHALRDLGVLSDKQKDAYQLTNTRDQLSVFFKGSKSRSLMLGGRVYGSSDRYALDSDTGKGYVIASSVFRDLESGQVTLRLHKYHGFAQKDVASIVVNAGKQKRKLLKKTVHDDKGKHILWSYAKTPDKPDQTLANFLERTARLTPREYKPKLDERTLEPVLTLEYFNAAGKKLGYLDLERRQPTAAQAAAEHGPLPKADYFMKTDQTRVWGEVSKLGAQRLEQDIGEVFGGGSSGSTKGAKAPGTSGAKATPAAGASKASTSKAAPHAVPHRGGVVPVRHPAPHAAVGHKAAPHAAAAHKVAPKQLSPLHPTRHAVPHKAPAKAPASR